MVAYTSIDSEILPSVPAKRKTYEAVELVMHADGVEMAVLGALFVPILGHATGEIQLLRIWNIDEAVF